ncbi:hypothetical protein DXG01_002016 [Tephrocybe rancida]|nr:hypothetical protein DXG01_002016 [Tephrocybe rancida]
MDASTSNRNGGDPEPDSNIPSTATDVLAAEEGAVPAEHHLPEMVQRINERLFALETRRRASRAPVRDYRETDQLTHPPDYSQVVGETGLTIA